LILRLLNPYGIAYSKRRLIARTWGFIKVDTYALLRNGIFERPKNSINSCH